MQTLPKPLNLNSLFAAQDDLLRRSLDHYRAGEDSTGLALKNAANLLARLTDLPREDQDATDLGL